MKKLILTSILAALVTAAMAQDYPEEYLGLPGDNLNLYAVMKLFQESETLEDFERNLNDENSRINNLDLNGDNLIDYIMVVDYVDGDVHTIVLQAALDRNDKQDLAVFTVQKFRNGDVQIQLIGDEALYGRNYIIEPVYDDNYGETPNPGYTGRSRGRNNVTVVRTTYVEVAGWPLIRYIYRPSYVVWRSSWYWGYYPSYWHPWRPFYWHYYYGYHYHWHPHYYAHYRHWNNYRYTRYNDFYYNGVRSHSPNVSVRIKEGNYRTTYSHPESRRDGEALYTKTYRGQGNRDRSNSTVSSQSRRSAPASNGNRNSSGSVSSSRRSTTTVTNRTSTNPSTERSQSTTRRSTTTSTVRSGNSSSDKPVVKSSERRAPASATRSSSTGRSESTASGNSRRSGQSGTTVRSSGNSKNSSTSSTSRTRSTSSSEKKNTSAKESEKSNSSRRK